MWELECVYYPTFWSLLSLSIGTMRRVLMVLLPLKCIWIPKVLQVLFNFSLSPCVGYHYGNIFVVEYFIVGTVVLVPNGFFAHHDCCVCGLSSCVDWYYTMQQSLFYFSHVYWYIVIIFLGVSRGMGVILIQFGLDIYSKKGDSWKWIFYLSPWVKMLGFYF